MKDFLLDIRIEDDYLNKGLLVPKVDMTKFKVNELFLITGDEEISISVDLNPKVEVLSSLDSESIKAERANPLRIINPEILASLNWELIYFQLIEYRYQHGWHNMAFTLDILKKIMKKDCFTLFCPKNLVCPTRFEELSFILFLLPLTINILQAMF